MASTSDTNLNVHSELYLCFDVFFEKFVDGIGRNRINVVVNSYANALLAFSETESSGKLNFVTEVVFGNKVLKRVYNLTRTFKVAGTADTNSYFHD